MTSKIYSALGYFSLNVMSLQKFVPMITFARISPLPQKTRVMMAYAIMTRVF
jgi:hypothetical protein